MDGKKQRILIYPIHNEVIPQRLFPALLDPEISPYFEITAFAGRPSQKDIANRLKQEIEKRKGYEGKWRSQHTKTEIGSLHLIEGFINKGFPYFQLDDQQCTLPKEAYDLCDCVFIGTNNLTHVPYHLDAFKHNKHAIIEKPYCVKETDLEAGESINNLVRFQGERTGIHLINKVTCHYAHKPSSLTLLENIVRISKEHGKIKNLEGYIEEIDDPEKPRTIATLNPQKSGGGIFFDTGCHLYSMLFALGGDVINDDNFKVQYDCYKNYGAETFAETKCRVKGASFTEDAIAKFCVSKFADKYKKPYKEPFDKGRKELVLTFEDRCKAHVLFGKRKIQIRKQKRIVEEIQANHPTNEYINILDDFHTCISKGKESFTSQDIILKIMRLMIGLYNKNHDNSHRIKKYK